MTARLPAILLVLLTISLSLSSHAQQTSAKLRQYVSRYYIINSDLDESIVKEADLRLTRMAEEYHQRTSGFSGTIREKLPFYLFGHEADYLAAGGTADSAGRFTGTELMALAGHKPGPELWRLIQHEGFHQFARAVIGGDLPIWVNEGLAEYFAEGAFTGDGFVTGLIPQDRLDRLRGLLKSQHAVPLDRLLSMTHQEWNQSLDVANYDEAWSLVHFLAHADNQRYQKPFIAYIRAVARGQDAQQARSQSLGDIAAIEQRWKQYWLTVPDNPTQMEYEKAAVATVTSFLARENLARKSFASFAQLTDSVEHSSLKSASELWLPASLLTSAMKMVPSDAQWSIDAAPDRLPEIVLNSPDGSRLTGTFTLAHGKIGKLIVTQNVAGVTAEKKYERNHR
jgi:hypothetical protein